MSRRIDCHTHVWPDAIAARALAPAVPEVPRQGDGRVSSLIGAMDASGVDMAVCLGVADGAARVEGANRFASSLDPDRLIGFGSVHPEWDPAELVENLRANRLRGVKLHPHYQGYSLDDRRLMAILEALEDEFVVLTHVGAGENEAATAGYCTPDKVRDIIRDFPRLRLIAAHFP